MVPVDGMDPRSRRERFHQQLQAGERLAGTFVHFASAELVEIAGRAGYDFAVLDEEHGPLGQGDVAEMLRAGDAAALPCIVRLPHDHPKAILKALDLGAAGIMVPQVESAAQAARIASAAHFPPLGTRSLTAVVRAAGYASQAPVDFAQSAEREVTVLAQIETGAGVAEAEAIAATPGVDMLFIGPTDLSAALGHPGNLEHPSVVRSIDAICAAAQHAGKPVGSFVSSREQVAFFRGRGVTLLATSVTTAVLRALRNEVGWLRLP